MKKQFLLFCFTGWWIQANTQINSPVLIYGKNSDPLHFQCLTDSILKKIDNQIEENLRQIIRSSPLPAPVDAGKMVSLEWPFKLKAGAADLPYHTVGPYFDIDRFSAKLLDFECGQRTYDGHNGTDIGFWPFTWKKMDEEHVDIVSAADGIIVASHDGDFDRRCGQTSDIGNHVIVQHPDGSRGHYWHMKTGTVSTKAIGSSVVTGEYLGKVGSSGNSSGPHLHFGVQAPNGAFIDPFSGKCNNIPSAWMNQRPYNDATLHLVLTHADGKGPVFPPCPMQEIPNIKKDFQPGELVLFSAFFHDQLPGDTVYYKIYKPDHSLFTEWTQTMQDILQVSVWVAARYLPRPAPAGTWHYQATYYGKTVSTEFNVHTPTRTINKSFEKGIVVYPNPTTGNIILDFKEPLPSIEVIVINSLGQEQGRKQFRNTSMPHLIIKGERGMYFLLVRSGNKTALARVMKQ